MRPLSVPVLLVVLVLASASRGLAPVPCRLPPAAGDLDFRIARVAVLEPPRRLDASDLDADGDVDLFVLEDGAGSTARLEVLLNDGGGFSPGWTVSELTSSGDQIWDVDLGDTDADGDADVVYCVPFGSPRQRFNDGHAGFPVLTGLPTYSFQFEHELGDLSGDGCLEVVYYEPDIFFDTYFGTLQGFCDGTFFFGNNYLFFYVDIEWRRRIALGDVNGDGWTDATFTSLVSGLRLIHGVPPASGSQAGWAPAGLLDSTPCADAVIADLNGDGRLDVAATVPSLDAVEVFLTNAHGVPGLPRRYAAGESPEGLAAADFDLDGVPELVVTSSSTDSVQILPGAGGGSFTAPLPQRVGDGPTDLVVADLDGDGDPDLAVTCGIAGHVALLFNTQR